MWIQKITLKNYRNYTQEELIFSSGLNVLLGKNAQGKTNFLEAIYFLALTRSHRTRTDKELIHFQQQDLSVSGLLQRSNGRTTLDIQLSSKGRFTKVNHLKQAKLSDYIGTMTVVLFAPEDLQLIKGSPSLRRKFVDIDLGQIKPIYLSDLSQYNHVLKQRNTYLKTAAKVDAQFLDVLDEQLAEFGSRVIQQRLQFIASMEQEADRYHHTISNQTEHLKIHYKSSIPFTETTNLKEHFLQALQKARQRDLLKKTTSVGPHRDDLAFFINDMPAGFGSQGQHRSLILSLKMAEVELIQQNTGDYPILLLDDVMSELDNYRQTELLKMIIEKNVQTFITTTSLDHLTQKPKDLKVFTVTNGVIQEKAES